MLLDKVSLNAYKAAGDKTEKRESIQYIQVTEKHTIATDGHILVQVEHQKDQKAEEFPYTGKTPIDLSGDKAVLIPATVAADVVKRIPKGKNAFPILKTAFLSNGGDTQEITTTDLTTPITTTLRQPDLKFPNTKAVWPVEGDPIKATVWIAIPVLHKVLDCLSAMGATAIELKVRLPEQAVEFRATSQELTGRNITGLIMPYRMGK